MKQLPRARASFLSGSLAAAGVATVRVRGDAAEFEYKFAHQVPLDHPVHVYLLRTWETVKAKSNGRIEVQVYGNSSLGSDDSVRNQVRTGAIQFAIQSGGQLGSIAPVAGIESVGFAFRDEAQFLRTMDGPLGAYIRRAVEPNGLLLHPKMWSLGPRGITTSSHGIAAAGDFKGLKIRASPAKISWDLYTLLGSTPVQIGVPELYGALQTHLIDGVDLAITAMVGLKLNEVQKYLSQTSHRASGQWICMNPAAFNALPSELRTLVTSALGDGADGERAAVSAGVQTAVVRLKDSGLSITTLDHGPIKARLGTYYTYWHGQFGDEPWTLLEKSVGKLG